MDIIKNMVSVGVCLRIQGYKIVVVCKKICRVFIVHQIGGSSWNFFKDGNDVDWQNIPDDRNVMKVVCSWNDDLACAEEFRIPTYDRELHLDVGTWLPTDRKSCWLKIVAIGVRHWRNLD